MNSEQLSDFVVKALDDGKGQNIVKLDVRKMTSVTDFMIVAGGTSSRHVQALVEDVAVKAKEANHKPLGVEGEEGGEWVLLDLNDVLVPPRKPIAGPPEAVSTRPPRKVDVRFVAALW